ncbi:MAG: DUF3035 domain-containing protein [Rhodospirillales bacterium]
MKQRYAVLTVSMLILPLLGACDSVRSIMGGKTSPDEFSVYSRAPLSIPPEFKLRPPSPGAERPQEVKPRDTAAEVMMSNRESARMRSGQLGGRERGGSLTPGEKALVGKTGGDSTDPEIRAIVNREAVVPIEASKTLADKVMFWRDPRKRTNIIDPQKENERIRKQQAQGKPVTGEGVPVIRQDLDRGFLDKLLFE